MKDGPRLLFIDIETAPIIMASWSLRSPEASAVWVERDTFILMASYKWGHEKTTRTVCLPDFPGYSRRKHDDKALCGVLHRLMDKADIICAHNGDSFDIKKINSRLIVNGYGPPSPYKQIDTLKIARRVFKFDSNKLDNICRYLGIGRKIPNTGATLWRGCVEGDVASWRTLRKYGKHDTVLLSKAYEIIKPWATNHPNMKLYGNDWLAHSCPTCRSTQVQRRGIIVKLATRRARFHCQDCGHWFSGGAPL